LKLIVQQGGISVRLRRRKSNAPANLMKLVPTMRQNREVLNPQSIEQAVEAFEQMVAEAVDKRTSLQEFQQELLSVLRQAGQAAMEHFVAEQARTESEQTGKAVR